MPILCVTVTFEYLNLWNLLLYTIYNMSVRHTRNDFDVEEGISDLKTSVHIEGAKKLTPKQSAWIQDEAEEIRLKSRSAVRHIPDNEAESTFITSPTNSLVSAMGSSRQRRRARTATESPSVTHTAEIHTTEDIPSPSSMSFFSLKNKEADTTGSHLVTDTLDHINGDETESKDVTSIGSTRHSLGESSVDGSRSFTSQSDSRSYRDRLRDRFQVVRERAGTSVVEMHTRSRLRRRHLNQPSVSRIDDLMLKEEAQVGEAMERHKEAKAKWKEVTEAVQEVLCCSIHTLHSNCISNLHNIACNKCTGKWMLYLNFGK